MYDNYDGIGIIAPRPRDEIVGAYDVLNKYNDEKPITVVYGPGVSNETQNRFLRLKEYFRCNQIIQNIVPPFLVSQYATLYFPDPSVENIPENRRWGFEGEILTRKGYNVIFYTLNKNANYIYQVDNPNEKLNIMEDIYSGEYNTSDIMYEGYTKWIF